MEVSYLKNSRILTAQEQIWIVFVYRKIIRNPDSTNRFRRLVSGSSLRNFRRVQLGRVLPTNHIGEQNQIFGSVIS